jgi:hypothetical protein
MTSRFFGVGPPLLRHGKQNAMLNVRDRDPNLRIAYCVLVLRKSTARIGCATSPTKSKSGENVWRSPRFFVSEKLRTNEAGSVPRMNYFGTFSDESAR